MRLMNQQLSTGLHRVWQVAVHVRSAFAIGVSYIAQMHRQTCAAGLHGLSDFSSSLFILVHCMCCHHFV